MFRSPPLLLLILLLSAGAVYGAQTDVITIFVEATIGVDVDAADISLNIGEEGGALATVINSGNIRDVIRLEGQLNPPNDWIQIAFVCTETIGRCDDDFSSGIHTVDNIVLTPGTNSTQFFIRAVGYRKTSTFAQPPVLQLTGFSLSNNTKQKLKDITINVVDPNKPFGPLGAPGLMDAWVPLLLVGAAIISYRRF